MTVQETPVTAQDLLDSENLPANVATEDASSLNTAGANKRQNRNEKKVRKMLSKTGIKPVAGVSKIFVKSSTSQLSFYIQEPDVYVSQSGNTYLIFGEPKIENVNASTLSSTAEHLSSIINENNVPQLVSEDEPVVAKDSGNESTEPQIGGDEWNAKDIELVMGQGNWSRSQVVKALADNENDVVAAIMSLTIS